MARCERCGQEAVGQGAAGQDPGLLSAPETPAVSSAGPENPAAPADPAEPGRGRLCPSCGADLGGQADLGGAAEGDEEQVHPKAPWHFKVLVLGSVIYLAYRLYQGIGWLIHHA